MLKNLGMRAVFAGNIGVPLADIVREKTDFDYIVLEISSFQLHYCRDFKPHIAVILNIESDHIDWHGSFESYTEDKFKIGTNQGTEDFLVVNEYLLPLMKDSKYKLFGNIQTISVKSTNASFHAAKNFLFLGEEKICSLKDIGMMEKRFTI